VAGEQRLIQRGPVTGALALDALNEKEQDSRDNHQQANPFRCVHAGFSVSD
jgi:hypothetical protein